MDLEQKVLEVMHPYLRSFDDVWTLSPCVIKLALIEFTHVLYEEGRTRDVESLIRFISNPIPSLVPTALPKTIQGLCTRYTERQQCGDTIAQVMNKIYGEQLIRGGLQCLELGGPESTWFSSGWDIRSNFPVNGS